MEKAQSRWVILSIQDKCVASTFWWPRHFGQLLVGVSAGAPLQRRRHDGQALKSGRRGDRSPKFAADTAASTVLVL
jgi:hypothetical protein